MVHNEFHGDADFVVMGRDISGPVTYAPTYVLSDDPLQRARRELARMVGAQWRREAGLRGLMDPVPLGVGWITAWGDPYGDHPHLTPDGPRRVSADLISFTEEFLALPHRRLVVLGGPGAGKSAFCVLLVLSLLAQSRAEDPVPVLLTLTSWDPAIQDFEAWLTSRLTEDYSRLHHPRRGDADAAARLIESQAVLPVLDGLDEISPLRRRLALRGLNRALAGDCPVVLTCRTSEYAALLQEADVLRSATVARALPVTALTALDYLRTAVPPQRQEPWRPVFAALENDMDGPLATALSTPLMISLLRSVYSAAEASPVHLLNRHRFPNADAIERHLLDGLVPAAFNDVPTPPGIPSPADRWRSDRAGRWLAELGAYLTSAGTEDYAWWQLPRRVPPWQRVAAASVPGGAISWSVAAAWLNGLQDGWVGACMVAFVAAIACGLAAGSAVPSLNVPLGALADLAAMMTARIRGKMSRGRLLMHFLGCSVLCWSTVGGLLTAVTLVTSTPSWSHLLGVLGVSALWLPEWLAIGVSMWLIGSLALPFEKEEAITPSRALNLGRRRAIMFASALALLLATGVTVLVFLETRPGLRPWWTWPLLAVSTGSGVAVVTGLRTQWGAYTITRILLAIQGRMPWRLAQFLDDAHRLGVLRQVGSLYQFRHASLRTHLAEQRHVPPSHR